MLEELIANLNVKVFYGDRFSMISKISSIKNKNKTNDQISNLFN
jgi:hypothetical protein